MLRPTKVFLCRSAARAAHFAIIRFFYHHAEAAQADLVLAKNHLIS